MSILNRARFVVVAASLLAGMASADDPYMAKWLEAGKGITAVEASFTVERWRPEGKARKHPLPRKRLWYNLTTGCWRATVEGTATRVRDDGTRKSVRRVSHYGTADGISWDGRQNEDGTNYFQIAIKGKEGNGFSRNPLLANAACGYLERCLYPRFSIELRDGMKHGVSLKLIQEMLTLQSDQPSKTVPGARELVYMAKHGARTATISHCVDFSDGARGYRTTAKVDGRVAEKTTCSDFRKVDGRWVAMKVSVYSANPGEKEEKQTGGSTVVIKEIKLNKSCDPRNIYFPVALGDQVKFPDEPAIKVEDMVEFRARFEAFLKENAEDDKGEEKAGEAKAEAPAKPAPAPKQP